VASHRGDSLLAVTTLCDDLNPAFRSQQDAQLLAGQGLVISDDDVDSRGHS
jgi:hypothetical protein